MAVSFPAIPAPDISPEGLHASVAALKNAVEMLTAQSGASTGLAAASKNDLATLQTQVNTVRSGVLLPLQGYLAGLQLSGVTTTSVSSTAGLAADNANSVYIKLGAITKSLSSVWLAGVSTGGMGAGLTIAASTWYHYYAIVNSGAADAYIDTSSVAANAPAGTTAFRRLFSFKTDGASHPLAMSQDGDQFVWAAPITETNISAVTLPTANRTLYTLVGVPPGFKTIASVNFANFTGSGTVAVLITSPDTNDTAVSTTLADVISAVGVTDAMNKLIRTDTTPRLGIRALSANTTCTATTFGWVDTRGRFA